MFFLLSNRTLLKQFLPKFFLVAMHIPNISLAYLIAELSPVVEDSILRKVQELENGWLKFRMQTRQGTKDLIATPDALFLTGYSMPAKQTTSGYGAFLRKHLANKKVFSFKQHGLDRIAVMEFEEFFLIFELFAKGNVILADKEMKISSAFRKEHWKDRILKKGEQYRFPSSKGINPTKLNEAKLAGLFRESETDVVRTLIKGVNIAPSFAEAACLASRIEKGKKAKELNASQIRQLVTAIAQLYSVKLKKERPLLAKKDGKEILLPFPLPLPGIVELRKFPSLNEALDQIYSKQFSSLQTGQAKEAIGRKKAELQKSMQQQREALQKLQQALESNREKAELIYANYSQLLRLVEAAASAKKEKLPEKEVMYKLKEKFPFLQTIDLKRGKLVVSLEK